jgi:hypothetical protein
VLGVDDACDDRVPVVVVLNDGLARDAAHGHVHDAVVGNDLESRSAGHAATVAAPRRHVDETLRNGTEPAQLRDSP